MIVCTTTLTIICRNLRFIRVHIRSIHASNQRTYSDLTTSVHCQNGRTSCNNFGFGFLALVLNIVSFLVDVCLLQSLHSLFVLITSVMARRPLCFPFTIKGYRS